MTEFDTKQIPSITPKQWERLRRLLDGERLKVLEVAWLRSATGMHSADALTLIRKLAGLGCGHLEWLLFHECAEHPAAIVDEPLHAHALPWECPECEETVTDPGELRTELRLRLTESVVFV